MIAIHKLIRQIRAGLAGENVELPAEALAAEYARLTQEAERRLETCAEMLARGSEYQALQLAEAEPGLLDLIAALSFAEAPEWTAHCTAQGLPVAPKFDPKAVQALDDLYAKGIQANHPLYKDYRAAVTSRDDARAIHIIRSIVRLNGGDANARAELARLENKLFQVQVRKLGDALAAGDETAILGALDELEPLAPAAKLAEVPEAAQAAEIRRAAERREAAAHATALAGSLPALRAEGAWRKAVEVLGQIAALQAGHGITLDAEAEAPLTEVRSWAEAERERAAVAQQFQGAVAAVGLQAEQIDTRLLTRATLTLPEAENLLLGFNRGWKEVEKFQRAVPDAVVQKVRSAAGALRLEVDRMQRQRRLRFGAVAAAVCVALAAGTWFAVRVYRTQDYARQLARLQNEGQVEAAEKMSAHLRAAEAGLAARPALRAQLDATDGWTHGQRSRASEADTHLSALEKTVAAGFSDADPLAVNTEMESMTSVVENLAPGLRAAPSDRLTVVRNGVEAWLASVREKRATEAGTELARLEEIAGNGLGYDRDRETLSGSLAQVEPGLKALEAQLHSPVAALELPPVLQGRATALRQRADLFRKELDLLHQVQEGLAQATTLDAYRQALGGFQDSRLSQLPEIQDARKLLAVFPQPDDVLAALVLPGDPGGWAMAKKQSATGTFVPEAVLPVEITKLLAIREDSYLDDIWQMTLLSGGKKREVFSRGEMKKAGPRDIGGGVQNTSWTGALYDPAAKGEIAAFIPNTTIQINRNAGGSSGAEILEAQLSDGSRCLARLELNRMTDAEGRRFERPLLKVFDDLVHEKQASPLYRAYVMQQLGDLIELRPYAWGLHYSASLRADLARLKKLSGDAPLRSMDWLLERKRVELSSQLASFFSELAGRHYLADAKRHYEVVKAALNAGLRFGGFVDGSGAARLLGEAGAARTLWVVADGGGVARLDPKPPAKAEGLRFSPVFFVPLDREPAGGDPAAKDLAQAPLIPLLQ